MIRKVVVPESEIVSISVPEDYIGKVLEIIAFTKDEGLYDSDHVKKTPSFTVLHTEDPNFKFNRDEANER